MKKLSLCFFLMAFFAPFAFADGTVSVSRVIPSNNSDSTPKSSRNTSSVTVRSATDSATRSVVGRSNTQTNTVASTTNNAAGNTVVRSGSRVLNLGTTSSSTSTSRGAGATVQANTISRSVSATSTANSARDNLEAAVNTVGRNARVSAASINNNPTVRRAGLTLRPSTAEVGGRATIAGTDIQTGSNIANEARSVQARATTSADTTITTESVAAAQEKLEQVASLNESCQQQYNDCMDQFCSVIDANQKRCSCSANLSNYTEVEEAVKNANTQLNEVAQRIRYVGLSADEIRAIMNATEAEEALTGATDTTETRSMLDEIEELIKDPSSMSSSYGSSTSVGLDMNLDFSSDMSDIFNLDFLNTNTTSLSNLRGTDLYSAAKKRCNTVLTQCKAAGANTDQITANYDLAIDKDCISYEQGLTKMNETLVSNVRSANLMLQKARLAVLQNKNQYDAKGCISALDACMKDAMVCGSDYTKCLDPTKKYIDENGEVILGQDITKILDFMQVYDNSKINSDFLEDSYAKSTYSTCDTHNGESGGDGSCNVKYLLQKIGTKQKVTDEGLCRAVLDKCQNYTYDSSGNYKPYNDVVVNYVQRAMVNIKSAQSKIISDYASNCMVDIANCYNQQVSQVNAWSSSASIDSIYKVMNGACRNVALTCAYAVFAADEESCPSDKPNTCIESISGMFYQSLLCPDNSTYTKTAGIAGSDNYVNEHCKCNFGYSVSGARCVINCPENSTKDSNGLCVCNSGYGILNEKCVVCPKNSYINQSGYCQCNKGFVMLLGSCELMCSSGQIYDEETNSCKCPDGWVSVNGVCFPEGALNCPENSFINESGYCECLEGYTPKYNRFGNIESCNKD